MLFQKYTPNPEKMFGDMYQSALKATFSALRGQALPSRGDSRARLAEASMIQRQLQRNRSDMMAKQYDLVIIGTGTASTVAALRARDAGWSVAVIDFRPFGGTCALRGCDPKKVLVGAAMVVDDARRLGSKGIAGDTRIGWQELMAFKRSFTAPVTEHKERLYAEKDIAAFHGRARFTGNNTLDVEGEALEARFILIASGAEAVKLGIPGEEHLLGSEAMLELDTLPEHLVIVGGGYIAAEFSHVAARAGTKVTILHRGVRMLEKFAPELVGWLMAAFRDAGIEVHTDTAVESVEQHGAGYRVAATRKGERIVFEADLVLHAAGRRPDFKALHVEAAGIVLEHGKLQLNEYLQSVSNPAVYAAGDAAQKGPPLTPVSTLDAKVASDNILHGNHRRADYHAVPSVAFTIPPIASVGLDADAATEKQLRFQTHCRNAQDWYTARQAAQPVYGYKILIEEETGCLLGAHLVGPHADELINLFALAIRHRLKASDLKETLFAYPTAASDIGEML
jgi:glutathione reductase (NADPH)